MWGGIVEAGKEVDLLRGRRSGKGRICPILIGLDIQSEERYQF